MLPKTHDPCFLLRHFCVEYMYKNQVFTNTQKQESDSAVWYREELNSGH